MSDFIVSARKYRPQRFEDVVGQEHVSQTLKNALRTEHLAHAFLFCGPRGVGKTTCARILAKVINCSNKTADFEPCGACDSCSAFAKNASFNIVELDAASNNSVDHIRSLVEQVRIPPQTGQYKVFIIDEVHMLSTAAFNAFLKTLEEPPPYAIFILATTEKHKILPTILSRCQIYDFKRISIPEMAAHLKKIADLEGIDAEDKALHVIARKADGALRDALSIFDRMVSGGVGKIEYLVVIDQLNILDYDIYLKVTDALISESLSEVMNIFNNVMIRGFEPETFLIGLAEHFRNLLMVKDQDTVQLLDMTDSLKDKYAEQGFLTNLSFLVSGLDILNTADVNYRTAKNKRLHTELALIKLCYLNRMIETELLALPGEKKNRKSIEAIRLPATPGFDLNNPAAVEQAPPIQNPGSGDNLIEKSVNKSDPQAVEQLEVSETKGSGKITLPPPGIISLKNIDALTREVEEEEQVSKNQVSKLDPENLKKYWDRYLDNCQSPSLKVVLEAAVPSLIGKVVEIRVGTQLARSMIQQELALVEFLRESLFDQSITFDVVLDGALAPDDTANSRPVSIKDKYKFMVDKNPLVEDLVRSLKLKPDE
jgi:DNA polymerase III subunit gamma/tau